MACYTLGALDSKPQAAPCSNECWQRPAARRGARRQRARSVGQDESGSARRSCRQGRGGAGRAGKQGFRVLSGCLAPRVVLPQASAPSQQPHLRHVMPFARPKALTPQLHPIRHPICVPPGAAALATPSASKRRRLRGAVGAGACGGVPFQRPATPRLPRFDRSASAQQRSNARPAGAAGRAAGGVGGEGAARGPRRPVLAGRTAAVRPRTQCQRARPARAAPPERRAAPRPPAGTNSQARGPGNAASQRGSQGHGGGSGEGAPY
jgi:hypothetical protein